MAITVTDKNLGHATAYGYAKSKGYTGTEEEFAELMASYATVAEQAEQSAEEAAQSADNAEASATLATEQAQASANSASASAGSATQASQSVSEAAQYATQASTSASTASTKATEASTSAQTASTKASEAATSATAAQTAKTGAETARTGAETARTGAETARTGAETAQEAAEEAAESVASTVQQVATNTADISDLKDDFEDSTDLLGAEAIEFTTGGYITTSGNVTSAVNLTPVTSAGYRYAVINCNAGDRFLINGKGGGSPRLWAFVDGTDKMISHADSGVTGDGLILVAPFNAKKLVINDNYNASVTPKNSYVLKSSSADDGIVFTPSCYIKTSGGIAEHTTAPDGINFTKTSSFYYACAVIPCEAYDRIVLTGTGGSTTYLLWSFVDSNGDILKSSEASATLTNGVIATPDGTAYCIINVDTRQPYSVALSGSIDVFGGNVEFSSGRIVTGSPNTRINYTPTTDAAFEYAIIDCVKGQHFTITATTENNSGKRLYCFVDLNGYVRERYNDSTSLVDADVVAPVSGKLVVNSLALYNHYVDTHYPYSPKNSLSVLPPNYLGALSYRALGPLSKGYICMMTDDGYDNGTIGLVQDTIPFAIAKDIPFTFALMRDSDVCKDDTKLAAVIDAVENHGCSIAQHGEFTWNGLSEEMLNTFFDLEKAFFDANGIEVKGAVIPAHYTTELIKAVCGGRFGVVRSGYSGIVPGTQDPAGTVTNYYYHYESGARSNLFCLSSYNCSGVSDAYNQQSVDYAYDNHTILIVYFHENAMDSTKWQTVSNLVDYAKVKGLTFVTLGEIPYLL